MIRVSYHAVNRTRSAHSWRAEVQQTYSRLQGELQQLTSKINELESDAEEHESVASLLAALMVAHNTHAVLFLGHSPRQWARIPTASASDSLAACS